MSSHVHFHFLTALLRLAEYTTKIQLYTRTLHSLYTLQYLMYNLMPELYSLQYLMYKYINKTKKKQKMYNPYTLYKVCCTTIHQNSTFPVHLTISAVHPGRADSDSWCGCQGGCCLHTLYLAARNSNQGLKRKRRKINHNYTYHSFFLYV